MGAGSSTECPTNCPKCGANLTGKVNGNNSSGNGKNPSGNRNNNKKENGNVKVNNNTAKTGGRKKNKK